MQAGVFIRLGTGKRTLHISKLLRADAPRSSSDDAKVTQPPPAPVKEGHYAKFKNLLRKYGKIAIVVHLGIATISLGACYALVSMGVDVNKWLAMVGMGESSASAKMGTFAVAYIAHKATEVVRLPLTIVLTPIIAKKLNGNKDIPDPHDHDHEHGDAHTHAHTDAHLHTNTTTSSSPSASSTTTATKASQKQHTQ